MITCSPSNLRLLGEHARGGTTEVEGQENKKIDGSETTRWHEAAGIF
jgi:hypothetical protein